MTIPDNFKGLDNIEEYKENNKYKYFAKSVTDYKEAIQVQKDIRKLYPDAFVVAFKNGKKIQLKDALNE
ncbi:MAG: hypothetical protein C0594_05135 [Marinilabiliales bacterium]|nr:MAG: hypothetical protein C0594_05135 [Marinilabiliales bacterium]